MKLNPKNTLGIILLTSLLAWNPALMAADSPTEITPTVDINTFTLTEDPLPARKFQLNFPQTTKHNLQLQKITPAPTTPQITTKPFRFNQVENTLYHTSLISLVALNLADYLSTREALKHDGLKEGNPLMKPFVKNDLTFAAVKLGLTISNHLFLQNLHKKNKTMAWVLSIASNMVMSYVVANNLKMIQSVKNK